MGTWRVMLETLRRCRGAAISISLVITWAGCAEAASSPPTGKAAVEPSATVPAPGALVGPLSPGAVTTEREPPAEDLALSIQDADAHDLTTSGFDDEPGDKLLAVAAARPLPGDKQTCNIRDTRPGPKAIWAACGNNVDQYKVVRHFFRGASRFPAPHWGCGRATLRCGHPETEE